MFAGTEMAQEVRRRLRDGELDISKHKGMPALQLDYREEWRLQPHDMPEMSARVLLDVHGHMVGTRHELVQLQPFRGEERIRCSRRPGQVTTVSRTIPPLLQPLCEPRAIGEARQGHLPQDREEDATITKHYRCVLQVVLGVFTEFSMPCYSVLESVKASSFAFRCFVWPEY
jgi:hypothetical protein